MFGPLLSWLNGAFGWLRTLWEDAWKNTWSIVGQWWAGVIVVVGWISWVITWISGKVTVLLDGLQAWVTPDLAHGDIVAWSSYFAFVNRILPVSEVFGMVVSYISLMVILSGYRLVKSWIPTVS